MLPVWWARNAWVLAERKFPVTELIPVASEKSIGKKIPFEGKEYPVVGMQSAIDAKPAIAIFSAGGGYIAGMGALFCGSRYHRDRQFERLADGP